MSQIVQIGGGRVLIAGMGENDKPGSLMIIRTNPFGVLGHVQAHSLPIEKMKLNFDNTMLFTAGIDGLFSIFEIKDKDLKTTKKEAAQVYPSDEILIEKKTRDDYITQIETLTQQVKQKEKNKQEKAEQVRASNMKKIAEMKQEIEHADLENRQRYDDLYEEKKKMEEQFEKSIRQMHDNHNNEMDRRKLEYAEKMEADQQRMVELQN